MATKPLRLLIAAAAVLPAALLLYSCWTNYSETVRLMEERTERTLDIIQEHALKVFQVTDRIIKEAQDQLGAASDAAIRADEERLHRSLQELQRALPEVEAIWAFDRDGRPLVSSTIFPTPQTLNNSDRDYFRAHAGPQNEIYIGENVAARIGNLTFFVISRKRLSPDGQFAGIIALTLPPTGLNSFYEKLARSTPFAAGLLRADGKVLARFPAPPAGFVKARTSDAFLNALRNQPEAGRYLAVSGVDEVRRWISYRKLPGYPVYVTAALDASAIWSETRAAVARDLFFALPAMLLVLFISWVALQRTKALIAEFSRRQQAEEGLRQAQRLEALGQLTGGVAHDFNNLLMVVRGNAERLKRGLPDDKRERALWAIVEAVQSGEKLTRQLLTFSRRQRVSPEAIDLRIKLPQMQELLESSLRGNIALQIEIGPDVWPVEADAAELELSILNLAVNSRDAMPTGGVLTLSARNLPGMPSQVPENLSGDFVALSIRDTGEGIPEDLLPKVFEPFFTTKPVGKGTGLGLSQVYGFAKQARGAARVRSEPGRGTEVTLYLPRAFETPRSVAASAEPAAVQSRAGRTILVVEDNASVGEVTEEYLLQAGYAVIRAVNAEEALRALQSGTRIDAVVSDIVMPGTMSGIELARQLATARPELPVVLATGYSEAAASATGEGFAIIGKPFSPSELHQAIERAWGAPQRSMAVARA